jgi:hypothetical protein
MSRNTPQTKPRPVPSKPTETSAPLTAPAGSGSGPLLRQVNPPSNEAYVASGPFTMLAASSFRGARGFTARPGSAWMGWLSWLTRTLAGVPARGRPAAARARTGTRRHQRGGAAGPVALPMPGMDLSLTWATLTPGGAWLRLQAAKPDDGSHPLPPRCGSNSWPVVGQGPY